MFSSSTCCGGGALAKLRAITRAAAKNAGAHLRSAGLLKVDPNWAERAAICEQCPICVHIKGVSYCGRPFTEQVDREPTEGCGCPTRAKARDPREHCPVNNQHQPATHGKNCDCKWCSQRSV